MSDERYVIRQERIALSLVSAAHFFSHFFILVLPPLFLAIKGDLDLTFTELGLIMTLYALGSASGQYPMGVFSDRFGPRWILVGGMVLLGGSVTLMGFATAYWHLVALALFAGLGDSVFHPADFAVITAQVDQKRLGRAYAIHAFMGFAGFAAAPVIVDALRVQWDWHIALNATGGAGLAMALILFLGRRWLEGEPSGPVVAGTPGPKPIGAIDFLKSAPILTLFVFYVAIALAGNGIQQFSPSALPILYEVDISEANRALFIYMVGISVGVLAGGVVADKYGRFDMVATIGYVVASAMMCVVALAWLPFLFVVVAFFVGGFMIGVVFPSRDLMVRSVAPKGSAGKAFGFVNSGFGYGGMVGPLIFGSIMDAKFEAGIYYTSAFIMMLAIGSALLAAYITRQTTAAQPAE